MNDVYRALSSAANSHCRPMAVLDLQCPRDRCLIHLLSCRWAMTKERPCASSIFACQCTPLEPYVRIVSFRANMCVGQQIKTKP